MSAPRWPSWRHNDVTLAVAGCNPLGFHRSGSRKTQCDKRFTQSGAAPLGYSPLRGLAKVNSNTMMVNGTQRNIAGDNVSHKSGIIHEHRFLE